MRSIWRYYLYERHVAVNTSATSPAQLIGEITGARSRTMSVGVKQMATAGLTVDRDNPLNPQLARGRRVILVIRDGHPGADPAAVPLFVGPIVSYQERDEDVAITAADAFWHMTRRRVGIPRQDVGAPYVYNMVHQSSEKFSGSTYGPLGLAIPKSHAISDVIREVNNIPVPYTGMALVGSAPSYFSGLAPQPDAAGALTGEGIGVMGPYVHRFASDVIKEISANLDAPDWVVDPVLPRLYDPTGVDAADFNPYNWYVPNTSMLIGRIRVGMPIGGVLRNGAAFELGVGRRNITDYQRLIDESGSANWLESQPPDTANDVTSALFDTATVNPGYFNFSLPADMQGGPDQFPVVLQDEVQTSLAISALRQQILSENVQVRTLPRQVITFDPTAHLTDGTPALGIDYQLGDIVPFRAVRGGVTQINALFRVYGVNRTLTDDGILTDAPVLVAST
jgi:hypothetical protein